MRAFPRIFQRAVPSLTGIGHALRRVVAATGNPHIIVHNETGRELEIGYAHQGKEVHIIVKEKGKFAESDLRALEEVREQLRRETQSKIQDQEKD